MFECALYLVCVPVFPVLGVVERESLLAFGVSCRTMSILFLFTVAALHAPDKIYIPLSELRNAHCGTLHGIATFVCGREKVWSKRHRILDQVNLYRTVDSTLYE